MAAVLVAEVGDDVLLHVADDDDEFLGAEVDELVHAVLQDGFARDLDHPLRLVVGQRSETGPLAGGENDCLHGWLLLDRVI